MIIIQNTFPASEFTQQKASTVRIRDVILYLYSKKRQLKRQLLQLHLTLANSRNNVWPYIQHTIEKKKLKGIIRLGYKNVDMILTRTNHNNINHNSFYPRVINNTNIAFSDKETILLEKKKTQYNLHTKNKNDLYSSPNIVRVIKSRKMRWAGHVARMGERRGVYRVLVGKREGKRPLGRRKRRW